MFWNRIEDEKEEVIEAADDESPLLMYSRADSCISSLSFELVQINAVFSDVFYYKEIREIKYV